MNTKLFKLQFISKYHHKSMELEFRAKTEKQAVNIATERLNDIDKKWISEPYIPSDFTLVSVDETFILPNIEYKTRDGKKVEGIIVDRQTSSSFTVEGYVIIEKPGKRDKKEWTIWTENGRNLAVGTSHNDLVLAV